MILIRRAPLVEWGREGLGLYAQPGNDPRGSKGGAPQKTTVVSLPLTASVFQLNVLVDQTPCARLADFGLLSIIPDSTTLYSYTQGGTTRWMSPELLDPEIQDHRWTIYSDCYALGMVIYEVLSERMPFYQSPNLAIPWKVLKGTRPERPQGAEGTWFTDDVWEVLGLCWMPEPGDRLSAKGILQCLEKVSGSWMPPPVTPIAGLLTQEPPGTITTESTDASGISYLSQITPPEQSQKPDLERSAGMANGVGSATPSTSSGINSMLPRLQ